MKNHQKISFWRTLVCAAVVSSLTSACSNTSAITERTSQPVQQNSTGQVLHHAENVQQLFKLSNVNISQGPFAHAQQTNLKYLLAMEPDKLLAPYLSEAGIATKADSYGNWENTGLDGHIGGHYLSALSLGWAATGDAELKSRLDYMLDELQKAQQANDGYLGGIPDGKAMWEEIRQGKIKADLFSLNDRWVPLYNIDKIFHGLRDAYLIGESEQAKTMLFTQGEWMLNITANLSDTQIQEMLYSEHGGLNEVFADMAVINGDERYMQLARKFSHQRILKPLLNNKDELTGLHANTQIPKIIGILKVAESTDDEAWEKAATFFWETVTKDRSVSIGGNSVREHFHDADDFTPMVEDAEGPETCNTYNMLKLSKLLFLHTGDTRYLDFYERATYNHILSSQHPEHGGLVYFTSMRPGHYRMYSSVHDSMWCCVGSGIENHSKYGELVYTHDENNLWVNLFMPTRLNWMEKGWLISQQTQFPDANTVSITLSKANAADSSSPVLHIRKPHWLAGEMNVKVNDEAVTVKEENGYLTLDHTWRDGDTITFDLPAKPHTEQLPDGQDYYSILYGPVVLATKVQAFENEKLNFVADDSRMGHIAAGPVCPPEALPVMLGKPEEFLASLQREEGDKLAFTTSEHVAIAKDSGGETTSRLIPFFRLHDSRYEVYWPQLSEAGFEQFVIDAKAQSDAAEALRKVTVDTITPGEQQPEVEHDFKGEGTRAGVNNGKHWRDATGWFEYTLKNPDQKARMLRITYSKGDVDRYFTISINGTTLAEVALPAKKGEGEYYTVDYPLAPDMREQTSLRLRFEANAGSVAGGIYGIRLVSK
ncbi:glycosyl hydrolase [Alteromonas pelagimontana]|uniref:Glycosyl hydrolase n=1 Tax=Alteromonas pelagimontana TaxID=1858656 RepID=A0A6M4MDT1_9ALTE|nr:glycoside hydrolase family 127 protein [Alteromonas pelagimontana]QJR81262.1 glycosyl hydrolase [Alteromonas pelagimontana]